MGETRPMDELRIYGADDPNDAPERRLLLPTFSPFTQAPLPSLPSLPTLPQYVIPQVATSLYDTLQLYWYSAFNQGFAAQKHQHQQQPQHQHQHQQRNHHHHHNRHYHHNHLHQQPFETRPASISTASSTSSSSTSSTSSSSASSSTSSLSLASSSAAAATAAASSASSNSSTPTHLQQQHLQRQLQHSNINNHHYYLQQQQQQQQLSHQRPIKHELDHRDESSHHRPDHHQQRSLHHQHQDYKQEQQQQQSPESQQQQHRPQHIKKPLNAYMIYMRERRPAIVKQGIIKESAAMNSMLGEQWRKLTKEEQAPYYKLAEQEKILHAQKYPGWSARDNYANQKKKKKLKLKSISLNGLDQSDKKCRARFGLNNTDSWCKPCRRKKKCIYRTVS